MKNARRHFSLTLTALVLMAAAVAGPAAAAFDKTELAAAQSRHRQERAACLSGQASQDLKTCLREADAAYAQARKGDLNDGAAAYTRNSVQRCEALPAMDRQACVARIQGQGSTSGSVAGGGIYRELVIRDSANPVPASSAAASAPAAR